MTVHRWNTAATAYASVPKPKPAAKTAQKEKGPIMPSPLEVARVAKELWGFLNSPDGSAARNMLRASGRHVIFGEDRDGGGYGAVYFLDGTGLHQSIEAMGAWIAYAQQSDVPKPKISPINEQKAIEAATNPHYAGGGKKPDEVMSWLYGQLDQIASQAPNMAEAS